MAADEDRLALAEVECRLRYLDDALRLNASPDHAPSMPSDKRQAERSKLESERARCIERQAELEVAVPDPDAIVAADGSKPPERRARHLTLYIERRTADRVKEAQKLDVAAGAAADKTLARDVRSRARLAKQMAETRIAAIDEEPSDADLTADQICPDGIHLLASHAYSCNLARPKWPCGAWPGQRAIARDVWRILDAAGRPRTDLNTWELTLYCGHTVRRTANRCYDNYTRASSGIGRPCEVCGVEPAFVITELLLQESAPARPEAPAPASLTPAARTRAQRRVAKLEAELADLRLTLAGADEP